MKEAKLDASTSETPADPAAPETQAASVLAMTLFCGGFIALMVLVVVVEAFRPH